jgi:hypothetical protein
LLEAASSATGSRWRRQVSFEEEPNLRGGMEEIEEDAVHTLAA